MVRAPDGKILLLKVNTAQLKNNQNGEYWDLPGGRIHQGQTVLETLNREVAEEIGASDVLNPKPIGMALSNIRIPVPIGEYDSIGLVLSVYQCSIPDETVIALSEEHSAYDWFSPEETAEKLRVKYPAEFCEMIAEL